MRKILASILLLLSLTAVVVWAAETNVPGASHTRIAIPLPSFTLKGIDGSAVTSSNFTGKALIICFFASWDKPSQRQVATLIDLQRDYGPAGFSVLGVALDTKGAESVQVFATKHGVNFPIALAEMQFIQDCGSLEAVPTMLVVELHGNIISRYVGVTDRSILETDLKAIFNQAKTE